MKSAVSICRNGTYDCTLGRFNAEAAAFRRRFSDSEAGEVPMVNPAVDDKTCHKNAEGVYLVKSIKERTTGHGVSLRKKSLVCGFGRVDYDNRLIPQHDLKHGSILF